MTAARWVGYLRSAITLLGLFRVEANQPVDFEPALKRAVFFRGTTLEFALIRAADAFLLWGDPRTAATLISRAAEENSHRPGFAEQYLRDLPRLLDYSSQMGDHDDLASHQASLRALLEDPKIVALVGPELQQQIAPPGDEDST
jgi:hypothetical protein